MQLKDDERIDLIQKNGFAIIQNKKWFSYGLDAVLLSDFTDLKPQDIVVDLGSGNGIIPLLLSLKNQASKIIGIEKQTSVFEMAEKSIAYNGLEGLIDLYNVDVNHVLDSIPKASVDVVVSNPPYFKKGNALVNNEGIKATARHETTGTIEDFIKMAATLLKEKGELYMVHRPMRLVDIFYYCRLHRLEPKLVQLVSPSLDKAPNIVLLKCVKGGNQELKYFKNLYVYKADRTYTDEIIDIYRQLNIDVFLEEHGYE